MIANFQVQFFIFLNIFIRDLRTQTIIGCGNGMDKEYAGLNAKETRANCCPMPLTSINYRSH